MTYARHCRPGGADLGTGQIDVCNISDGTVSRFDAASGLSNCRGAVVMLGGLGGPGSSLSNRALGHNNFTDPLIADGWYILAPPYIHDFNQGDAGIFIDITNDTGNGARYLATVLLWWEQIVNYIKHKYHANFPIVLWGASWGGWNTLSITKARTSTLVGYMPVIPATIFSNVVQVWTAPNNFGTLDTSGLDVPVNALNSVTIPGLISYSTNDPAVGYGGATTIASGSNAVNVNTLTGTQDLNVADISTVTDGPCVLVSGLTGGTGRATISFSGKATGVLHNAKLINGSGVMATGNLVEQSRTLEIIASQNAAQPSHQVSGHSMGNQGHGFSSTDNDYFVSWIEANIDPLAPLANYS